jgi:hypothetical protein
MLKRSPLAAVALLALAAPVANADQLFTNWSGAVVGGNLWTSGGPCPGACYALVDNFSNPVAWDVTDITFYVALYPTVYYNPSNWRYGLFDAQTGGNAIIATTDPGSFLVFTDTGNAGTTSVSGATEIYKGVISGLNVGLPAGTYWLRFTNTQSQAVYPADASQPSAQTISPGLATIYDASSDALLSTTVNQTTDNWAFEVYGEVPIFRDGFEGP